MRGDDAPAIRHERRKCRNDLPQRAQPAIGGDDADEVPHRLAKSLLFQHGERRFGAQSDVDQGRLNQAAKIGAGVDQRAQRFHFGDDSIKRAHIVGMRVKRGGVAVGEAAAFGDRRSFRRHVRFHLAGHTPGHKPWRAGMRGDQPARTGRDPLAGVLRTRNTRKHGTKRVSDTYCMLSGKEAATRVETRTDTLSREERSARMALVRSRDTKPELRVRRFLHAAGLRYRLHQRVLSARPDLVFATRRTVVFVHGCIWHRHPDPACPLTRTPKSRIAFWTAKFAENVARDQRQRTALEADGWRVLVIWECQTGNQARLEELARDIRGGLPPIE